MPLTTHNHQKILVSPSVLIANHVLGRNTAELNLTESVLDTFLDRGVSIEFGLDDLPLLD